MCRAMRDAVRMSSWLCTRELLALDCHADKKKGIHSKTTVVQWKESTIKSLPVAVARAAAAPTWRRLPSSRTILVPKKMKKQNKVE